MLKCNIEELIKKSGLRKAFVADALGISVRQLRNYERLDSYIPMDKAYVLSSLIGCKVDDLYEYKEESD